MKDISCRLNPYVLFALLLLLIALPELVIGGYIKDPNFGDGGVKLVEIGNFDDRGYAAAVQADGKIIVTGTSENGATTEVAVVRFNTNGSLDTNFNIDGSATFSMGSGNSGANSVAVKDDGTIVIAGYSESEVGGQRQIALLQITSAGLIDIGFGPTGSGIFILEDGGNGGEAFDVILDEANRILVAGQLSTATQSQAVVARFLQDGRLDTTFGDQGISRITGSTNSSAAFLVLQSDGKIILGGMREEEGVKQAVAYRLEENGVIDESYGTNGAAILAGGEGNAEFLSGVLTADDKLIAAGYTTTGGNKYITTARFVATGQLDSTFGSGGKTVNTLAGAGAAYSVAAKSDNSILVAGEGESGENNDMVLIHLDSSGSMEKSTMVKELLEDNNLEDEYGLVASEMESIPLLIDIGGEDESGRSVLALDDGRVLVAGFASDGVDDDMAIVAFTSDEPSEGRIIGNVSDIPYYVATIDVSNVTRNSAMSGGVISKNILFSCDADEGDETDDCRPTVTGRGVVYGIVAFPSYDPDSSDTTSQTDDTSTSGSVFPDWVDNTSHNYDLVRRGQTSDGSGTGTYGSDITDITPDAYYYVRAYAVLSDDTVIYGNQVIFKTDDACFIATAAYGSILEPHVSVLRQFRDTYLKTNSLGSRFVNLYYHWSPQLADFISRSSLLRLATRIALFPLVFFSYFMVYISLQLKVVLLLIGGTLFFATFKYSRR